MGTKTNPGKYDCLDKLDPDEPFFVLRAQDRFAPMIVRQWAELVLAAREAQGLPPSEKLIEAYRCANAMQNWGRRKVPD
jgi:hypothetical protein